MYMTDKHFIQSDLYIFFANWLVTDVMYYKKIKNSFLLIAFN